MRDAYTGEAQFLAWGDGPAGPWVKILLPDSDDLGPFRGMTAAKKGMAGQLLAMKIVEIYPDNPEKITTFDAASLRAKAMLDAIPTTNKLGPLAMLAVRWCRDPAFRLWATVAFDRTKELTEDECRAMILDACKIGSRRELDTVPSAAHAFHTMFREPFMADSA